MKTFAWFRFGIALVTLALSGCAKDVTAPEASWLRASITGHAETRYEGTGRFDWGGDSRPGTSAVPSHPRSFVIVSKETGPAPDQHVLIWMHTKSMPSPGRYPIALPEYERDTWTSFAATYGREVGNTSEAFVAHSGELHITAATATRVEGTFRFRGLLHCLRTNTGTGPMYGTCRPAEVDPDAPAIEVSGSFVAAPDTAKEYFVVPAARK
jgi:hypothetical protein